MHLTLLERRGPVALLTLNSPENRNALSSAMVEELLEHLDALERDPAVRVMVLYGGPTVFCSGVDLKKLRAMTEASNEAVKADSSQLSALLLRVYTYPKPVLAALEGAAVAGGAGLLGVCDLAVAAEDARVGYTEVKLGFVPALVGVFLVRLVGEKRARELLLTGKLIPAQTALEWGLVNEVVGKGQALERALALALELTRNAPTALSSTKELLAHIPGMELNGALRYAVNLNAWTRGTLELREGVSALLEKRAPHWTQPQDEQP